DEWWRGQWQKQRRSLVKDGIVESKVGRTSEIQGPTGLQFVVERFNELRSPATCYCKATSHMFGQMRRARTSQSCHARLGRSTWASVERTELQEHRFTRRRG